MTIGGAADHGFDKKDWGYDATASPKLSMIDVNSNLSRDVSRA
jgi:hypothetical protein